jgi:hypothetical protein
LSTIDFATGTRCHRFADLGEVMKIYTDAGAFDTALAQSIEKLGAIKRWT